LTAADVVVAGGPAGDVPWWSFTKTVLAAAALVLVRDGRLALDERLSGRSYTLRQLLQHRAGVADYGGVAAYHAAVAHREDAWPLAELLTHSNVDTPLFPPGQGWAYSNIGYLYVRQLIEAATGQPVAGALARLVLQPLDIANARLATNRADLAGVSMGDANDYDPRWVYHGLLVGPLADAAQLLHRLMTGTLLPPDLLSAMRQAHSLGGPLAGRPWITPGYGLGMMIGGTTDGASIAGHTGGGPGSVVAVYHLLAPPRVRTAASFSSGDEQGFVERRCIAALLRGDP
jgi:CubicO group peptidase (beta-lactamase class C family)